MRTIVEVIELLAEDLDDRALSELRTQIRTGERKAVTAPSSEELRTSRDLAFATIHHVVRVLGARRVPTPATVRRALLAAARGTGKPPNDELSKWKAIAQLLRECGLTTADWKTTEQEIRRERGRLKGGAKL
jgi:hypothetical protein